MRTITVEKRQEIVDGIPSKGDFVVSIDFTKVTLTFAEAKDLYHNLEKAFLIDDV